MNNFVVTIAGRKNEVGINDSNLLSVNGETTEYEFRMNENKLFLKLGNKLHEIFFEKLNDNDYYIYLGGKRIKATVRSELEEKINALLKKKENASSETVIKAPMPGLLLKILKREGEDINVGEPVAILEAMKMENEIRSQFKGKVSKIFIQEGKSVEKGELILKIN